MKRFIVLILLCLTLPQLAVAQGDPTMEVWPPDPSTIFAEGVEVIEITVRLIADNDARRIYVYNHDTGDWLTFPFSEDLTNVFLYQRDNGRVFIRDSVQSEGQRARIITTWELNPETGDIFLPYDNPCGNQNREMLNSFYLPWSFYQDPETEQMYLCSIETGELGEPLPNDISWAWPRDDMSLRYLKLSPNGEWLIAYGSSQQFEPSHIYAYEIATGTLNDLGGGNELLPYSRTGVRWITGTQIVVSNTDSPEWWTRRLLVADVTQPNSMAFAIQHVRISPLYYDDPPRFELVPGLNGSGIFLEDCVLQVYDLETQSLNEYALGNLCDYGIILPNGDGARLYREASPDREAPTTLVRFNPFTGEREALLTGEIEWLESVSPNGRYAVVLMDSNGRIGVLPNGVDNLPMPSPVRIPNATRLVLYDLIERRIVYETPTGWSISSWDPTSHRFLEGILDVTDRGRLIHGAIGAMSRLTWLRDDAFWLRRLVDSETGNNTFEDYLLRLEDGQWTEFPIGEVVAVYPDRMRLLVRANDNGISSAINAYDVETGETSPVINALAEYSVEVEGVESDQITVTISPLEEIPHTTTRLARYVIQLSER